jgi:hypothetical protein
MSYHAVDDPDVPKPWFMKKTVWIVGAVVFLVLAGGTISLIIVGMRKVPEIGGGVTIEADPDTKIYIGDKLVGTTQVSFAWDEFFGDEKHEAMAVELPVGPPLTPNALVEPGSTILEMQSLSGGGSGGSGLITGSGHTYLLRRADGQLDQVTAMVIDWAQVNQPPRHFLLTVRLRKGNGESTVFFNQSGSGSSTRVGSGMAKLFGQSPIEVKRSYRFSAGALPVKYAEEVKSKGLWEPGK